MGFKRLVDYHTALRIYPDVKMLLFLINKPGLAWMVLTFSIDSGGLYIPSRVKNLPYFTIQTGNLHFV